MKDTDADTTTSIEIAGNEGSDRASDLKTPVRTTYRAPMDLLEFGDRYEINIDLPGTKSDWIDVTFQDNILCVHASVPTRMPDDARPVVQEYGVGDFSRRIRLGEDIDADRMSARFEQGVLSISLPKHEQHRARRIEIKSS